jgi:hypothetical protein
MNSSLYLGSIHYTRLMGLPPVDYTWAAVRSDPVLGLRIAKAYERAHSLTPAARFSYSVMREEIWRQLDYLLNIVGIDVTVTPDDPYQHGSQLHAELREGRMRVWSTSAGDNPHPLFSNDDNDAFRAVHDAFGHGAIRLGFDPDGEEAAWMKHSQMFSPEARPAMTTETRGQTCAFVYGNGGKFFSPQKAVLLPRWCWQ